jgi:hypothetical protein
VSRLRRSDASQPQQPQPSTGFENAMEKLFLSYTYRPHPDHEADLERLRRCVVRAIEAMCLRVVDGVDVGGRPLDDALKKRIEDADGLIALVTPQADDAGGVIDPTFVLGEFQYAEGQKKPTMRLLHHLLAARGLGAGNEYTPYRPGGEVDVILKLMNTIALWKREYGKAARVRIEPDDLAVRYDETQGDRCEFQVISQTGNYRDFERASLRLEPGAAYAHLPKLREGERVRLRLRQGGRMWQSRYAIDPFVGGVRLEEQP